MDISFIRFVIYSRTMKIYLTFSICIMLFALFFLSEDIKAQEINEPDTSVYAQIEIEEADHDFGDIHQGGKVEHTFNFINSGTAPLIINNVLTTCGCTAPEWPKEPIPPQGKSVVKVIFDSTSKIGRQNKVITIRSNSKSGDARLRISAMVLPAKKKN